MDGKESVHFFLGQKIVALVSQFFFSIFSIVL